MGKWKDFWFGPEDTSVKEQRSGSVNEPLPSDPSTALAIPVRNASPSTVTTGDALGLSSVYRAVSIYVTATKQLGLDTFKNDEKVNAPLFIKRPDVSQTRSKFFEQTITALLLNGNAYWLITRDAQGRVTNLENLNPLDVAIETNQWGKTLGYKYMGYDYKPTDIQHLSVISVPGMAKGLGPIQAAQAELHGTINTRNYASNWFDSSGVPNGYLKTDAPLNAEDAAELKAQWHTSVQGGTTAVLDSGLTYSPIYLSPKDAQFIESQAFNKTQIATLFGIPPRMMLVEAGNSTYANVQDERRAFVDSALMNYLVEIEDALSSLLPRGTEARFNLDAYLRASTKERYESHEIALRAGFLTEDEVREIEKLPPLPKKEAPAMPALPAVDPAVQEEEQL